MDDTSRAGRRQNEAPAHQTSLPRYPLQVPPTQGRSMTQTGPERYRPAPLSTSPATPRSIGVAGTYSPYYQEAQASFTPSNMAYGQQDYGSDGRAQGQSFGNYNAGLMMYNVAHTNTQAAVYDTQQFSQRQQAAMQMMTPDAASTYFSAEAGTAATAGLQHPSQNSAGAPSDAFQQQTSMVYGGSMAGVNTMQQQQQQPAGVSDGQAYLDSALEEKWADYQRQLGSVLEDVKTGSLENAAETLLSLSNWLLTQVADLGLSQDDASLHDERIKLWDDFNHAWLALGLQQKTAMESGQQAGRSQGLMSEETVKKMGDELVRLCDGIERQGLVDYQYGVWEEQIESILEECLDLFDSAGEADSAADTGDAAGSG
ncbi:hypothetical protein RJ55_05753 [Drechmeria coniospora]|nr:hypothetical protein RJ55_05753 [Drechmeria coniospora]